jgi:hypothetical protein
MNERAAARWSLSSRRWAREIAVACAWRGEYRPNLHTKLAFRGQRGLLDEGGSGYHFFGRPAERLVLARRPLNTRESRLSGDYVMLNASR